MNILCHRELSAAALIIYTHNGKTELHVMWKLSLIVSNHRELSSLQFPSVLRVFSLFKPIVLLLRHQTFSHCSVSLLSTALLPASANSCFQWKTCGRPTKHCQSSSKQQTEKSANIAGEHSQQLVEAKNRAKRRVNIWFSLVWLIKTQILSHYTTVLWLLDE